MRIPVHSPWLPGYTEVEQTVLVILTLAGLFPDRLHTSEKGMVGSVGDNVLGLSPQNQHSWNFIMSHMTCENFTISHSSELASGQSRETS